MCRTHLLAFGSRENLFKYSTALGTTNNPPPHAPRGLHHPFFLPSSRLVPVFRRLSAMVIARQMKQNKSKHGMWKGAHLLITTPHPHCHHRRYIPAIRLASPVAQSDPPQHPLTFDTSSSSPRPSFVVIQSLSRWTLTPTSYATSSPSFTGCTPPTPPSQLVAAATSYGYDQLGAAGAAPRCRPRAAEEQRVPVQPPTGGASV